MVYYFKLKSLQGSFKRYVTLFLAKICPSLPPLERAVTLAICPLPLLRNEIFDPSVDLIYSNVMIAMQCILCRQSIQISFLLVRHAKALKARPK